MYKVGIVILFLHIFIAPYNLLAESNKKKSIYTSITGAIWEGATPDEKDYYVYGVLSGQFLFYNLMLDDVQGDNLKKMKEDFNAINIPTLEIKAIVKKIDQFYSDNKNIPIPLYLAFAAIAAQETGENISSTLKQLRQQYGEKEAQEHIKPSSATKLIKGKKIKYSLSINNSKWKQIKSVNKDSEYSFTHKDGVVWAFIIPEKLELTFPFLKEAAFLNFQYSSENAKIVFEEIRIVNNKKIMHLQMEGLLKSIPFVYYGYYYTSKIGSVQVVTYTTKSLFEKYKNDMLDFLNGFGTYEDGSLSKNESLPKKSNDGVTGTGWLSTSGHIVTSDHIIEGKNNIKVVLFTGETIEAKVSLRDKTNDIALLRPKSLIKLPYALSIAKRGTKLGSSIFTVGYPHPDIMGTSPKVTTGRINSLTGLQNDPRTYQISIPVQSGNSGGPILNTDGEVIGVVTSKLSAMKMVEWTGDLPQNVNYAVKAPYVEVLLDAAPNRNLLKPIKFKSKVLEEIVDKIKKSIVMVIAE